MLRVGVVGCGHLGKIHIKLLNQSESFDLLGVYDNDFNISKNLGLYFWSPSCPSSPFGVSSCLLFSFKYSIVSSTCW